LATLPRLAARTLHLTLARRLDAGAASGWAPLPALTDLTLTWPAAAPVGAVRAFFSGMAPPVSAAGDRRGSGRGGGTTPAAGGGGLSPSRLVRGSVQVSGAPVPRLKQLRWRDVDAAAAAWGGALRRVTLRAVGGGAGMGAEGTGDGGGGSHDGDGGRSAGEHGAADDPADAGHSCGARRGAGVVGDRAARRGRCVSGGSGGSRVVVTGVPARRLWRREGHPVAVHPCASAVPAAPPPPRVAAARGAVAAAAAPVHRRGGAVRRPPRAAAPPAASRRRRSPRPRAGGGLPRRPPPRPTARRVGGGARGASARRTVGL